ncbi:MAG TPA: hypothetical protein VFV34_03255 [Blastocatellia bacterium]|nr:hypothetical protein [Blastocatellia bacterium]
MGGTVLAEFEWGFSAKKGGGLQMMTRELKMRHKQHPLRRALALLPLLLLVASWNPALCLCANPFVHFGHCSTKPAESLTPAVDHCEMAQDEAQPECVESGGLQNLASAANYSPTEMSCCRVQPGTVSPARFVSSFPLNLAAQRFSVQPEVNRVLSSVEVFRPPRSRPIYLSLSSFLI